MWDYFLRQLILAKHLFRIMDPSLKNCYRFYERAKE